METREILAALFIGGAAWFLVARRPSFVAAESGAAPGAGTATIPPGAPARVREYRDDAVDAGRVYGVSPQLILAVIWQESAGVPSALGAAGEIGLMQVTDIAARDAGFKAPSWASRANIYQGTAYLATIRDRYGAETPLEMLRGYNGGPSAIHGAKPAANKYAREVLAKAGWV